MRFIFNKQWLLPFLFFLSISGLLVFSWFRYGFIYGGGDVGLPTYDPQRILEISKYLWWEASAPGSLVPNSTISAPLAFVLSILQTLGFSDVGLQATLFYVLLVLMGYGMYLVGLSVFGRDKRKVSYLAALFYMFNPYMMIQVWHRFVHTTFFLAAALPYLVLFWKMWLYTKKPKFLLLFLITNFVGVYLYGTIAFVLTVWLLIFLITIIDLITPWKNWKVLLQRFILFGIGFVLWLMINSWWLVPTFSIGPSIYSQQHTTNESLGILMAISKQTIIPYSFQLVNPFYVFEQAEFGDIYKTFAFKLMPWIFVVFILLGLFKSLYNKKLVSFGVLYMIILFLTKGAAEPFGYFFIYGFKKFFFLGALRNPFEKIGILLPLIASILFAFGVNYFHQKLSGKISITASKIILVCIIAFSTFYYWPMFTGHIFGTVTNPAFIKVPEAYVKSDQLIQGISKTGTILHLPLSRNEGIPYKWEYGYNGVEPSSLLFSSLPSIARGYNLSRLDDTLTGLSLIFEAPYSNNSRKILSLLQAFNIRFIILHKDMVWRGSDVYDPLKTEEVLNNLFFLEKRAQFPELVVYELLPSYYEPKIVLSNQMQLVIPEKATIRMWPWLARTNTGNILTTSDNKSIGVQNIQETIVFPSESFTASGGSAKGADVKTDSGSVERQVHSFDLPTTGKYELLLSNPEIASIYPDSLNNVNFQIGAKVEQLKGVLKDNMISYGELDLSSGKHEISYENSWSSTLVPALDKVDKVGDVSLLNNDTIQILSNGQQLGYIDVDLGPVSGEDVYKVNFEGKFLSGVGYYVQIIQDTDLVENNVPKPRIKTVILNTTIFTDFISFDLKLNPLSPTTRMAKLRILVDPTEQVFNTPEYYGKPTSIQIKNLAVYRLLNNEIFLKNKGVIEATTSGKIEFEHKSPVLYEGKIDVEKPSYLIFKETFDKGWELTLTKNNQTYKPSLHYLANLYSNSWFIEQLGEYRFKIEFVGQQKFVNALYFVGLGWIIVFSMVIVTRRRRGK